MKNRVHVRVRDVLLSAVIEKSRYKSKFPEILQRTSTGEINSDSIHIERVEKNSQPFPNLFFQIVKHQTEATK